MTNLGKNKQGLRIYISDEEVQSAAQDPMKWKSDLNAQQWAKLRKLIRKINKNTNKEV